MSFGGKLVVRALAAAVHPDEPSARAVVYFLDTLARAGQRSVLIRIRRRSPRWINQREQHEQSDGPSNRPKGPIRPSGRWIPAKLAAAREHYDAAQESHISIYQEKSV